MRGGQPETARRAPPAHPPATPGPGQARGVVLLDNAAGKSHEGGHAVGTISRDQTPLDEVRVGDMENFQEGPPHELFRRLRAECPVHWSDGITEYPDEDGFWSVTRAEDVFTVSHDWQTFSSEVGGFTVTKNGGLSLELQQAMFIGMDPPKHDRIKALF